MKELDKIIPFKFRVWNWTKDKKKFSVLWYIDARDVMDMLDNSWVERQRDYKDVWGQLFCWVAIKKEWEWVWKRDTWSESNVEKEKWEASDSFKRACVNRGIGRFLYTLPQLWITDTEVKANKYNLTVFIKTKFKKELTERSNKYNKQELNTTEEPPKKPYFPESKFKWLEANKDVYKNFNEAIKAITNTYQLSLEMEIKIRKLYSPIKERPPLDDKKNK